MDELWGYSVLVDDHELWFRDRVTAQWAVFFNALGVTFAHVPQGFGSVELPDFWLPQAELWATVTCSPRQLTTHERADCEAVVHTTGHGYLLLLGPPEYKPYSIIYADTMNIVANDGFTILKTLKLPLDQTYFHYIPHLLSVSRGRGQHGDRKYPFVSECDAAWYPDNMDYHVEYEPFSDLRDAVEAAQQGTLIQTLTRQVRADNPPDKLARLQEPGTEGIRRQQC
jgi:hypothetical protein